MAAGSRRAARAVAASPAPPAHGVAVALADSLLFRLIRLVNRTARPFTETLARRYHLGLSEWRVLAVLAAHAELTASALADRIGIDKMSVSRSLATLERRGRIARRADPNDGRKVLVRATTDGRTLVEQVGTLAMQREAELFRALDAASRARLDQSVARLLARLDEIDAPRPGAAGNAAGLHTGVITRSRKARPQGTRRANASAPAPKRSAARRTAPTGSAPPRARR